MIKALRDHQVVTVVGRKTTERIKPKPTPPECSHPMRVISLDAVHLKQEKKENKMYLRESTSAVKFNNWSHEQGSALGKKWRVL